MVIESGDAGVFPVREALPKGIGCQSQLSSKKVIKSWRKLQIGPGIYLEKILPAKRDDLSNILDFDQLISDIMIQFVKIPVGTDRLGNQGSDQKCRRISLALTEAPFTRFSRYCRDGLYASMGAAGGAGRYRSHPCFHLRPGFSIKFSTGRDVILPSMEDFR